MPVRQGIGACTASGFPHTTMRDHAQPALYAPTSIIDRESCLCHSRNGKYVAPTLENAVHAADLGLPK